MSNQKRDNSAHIRYNDKVAHALHEFRSKSHNDINKELSLLIIDGIAARRVLSKEYIERNREELF